MKKLIAILLVFACMFAMASCAMGGTGGFGILTQPKPMASVRIDMHLHRNTGTGHGIGHQKGVLHRDAIVVPGVPDKGGRGGFVYVELQRETVHFGLCCFLAAAKIVE